MHPLTLRKGRSPPSKPSQPDHTLVILLFLLHHDDRMIPSSCARLIHCVTRWYSVVVVEFMQKVRMPCGVLGNESLMRDARDGKTHIEILVTVYQILHVIIFEFESGEMQENKCQFCVAFSVACRKCDVCTSSE